MRITKYQVRMDKEKHPVLVKDCATNYAADQMNSAAKIVKMCNTVFGLKDMAEEHVYVIAMTAKCRVVGVFELSHGTVQQTVLASRELFMRLLLVGAACYVIVHNHPSGDPTPSNTDINATRKLREASKIMEINFEDHIILGGEGIYCSIRDEYGEIFS